MSARSVMTTYEVEDNRMTRSVLSSGGKVIGSERSTALWTNPQAYESLRGYKNLIEASREATGSRLHAKGGQFTARDGGKIMFVGSANMTETGLGMRIDSTYSRYSGRDKSQFNYFVASKDSRLTSQMDQVMGAILTGRAPVSTQNLLVVSSRDHNTAANRLEAMINNRSNKAPLYLATATLSDNGLIDAIIGKAQRGDQVWVGLGGTRREDTDNQQRAFTRLTAAARTLKNLRVAHSVRPFHANMVAMGDEYVTGSARFSTSALRGYNGQRSTELILMDRDRRIAEHMAGVIKSSDNFDFKATEALYMPFTEMGTYMPAMLPLRGQRPMGANRGSWQFIVDPKELFNAETSSSYAYLAAQNPGQVPGAGRGVGFFEYLFTEAYAAGHEGRLPTNIPDSIRRSDIDVKLPTHGQIWRGRLADWAADRFDTQTASLVSQLTAVRGNRGPVGTLLVNLGALADRRMHHAGIERMRASMGYRPEMPQESETYAEMARWANDNVFNAATNVGMLRLTFAAGSMTAAMWAGLGSMGEKLATEIETTRGGPVTRTGHAGVGFVRQVAGFARTTYLQVSRGLWDLQREAFTALAGREGQTFMNEIDDVYNETKPRTLFRTTDDRLALQMKRYWGGKITVEITSFDHLGKVTTDPLAAVRTITEYKVEHDARGMNMLQRWRAMHAAASRFASKIPIIGAFNSVLSLESNAHAIGARQIWWDSTKAYFKGDFAKGAALARESYLMRRSAPLMIHGQGGLSPGAAVIRRAIPLLFAAALTEHGVGMVMAAGHDTLEQQVQRQRDINNAGGQTRYFGVSDLMPRDALDLFPAAGAAALWGVSWGAQFVAGMGMMLNPVAAARRATRMTQVATDLRGYEPYREIDRAGLKNTSVSSVAGFFVDTMTAMQRHTTQSLIASREDLLFKVVSKNMATRMMTQQTERSSLTDFRKMVTDSAGSDHYSRKELARVLSTLDNAADWAGRADKAQVTTGLAFGLRVGHLSLASIWGGAIYTGGRWNMMFTAMGPVGSGMTLGFKVPVYYSAFRGARQFQKWLNGGAVEENTADWGLREILSGTGTNTILRKATELTGGEAGWLGRTVQWGMGFGYQPSTNWEGLVRLGAGVMAASMSTTPLGQMMPLAPVALGYGAAAWFAREPGAGSAVERMKHYYRTGEMRGAGMSFLDNITRGTGHRFGGGTGLSRLGFGAVGFVGRIATFALDLPTALPRLALRGAGWTGELVSALRGGSYQYRTSHMAMASRGIRSVGRAGMIATMLYTGYKIHEGMRTGTMAGYVGVIDSARRTLNGIPLIGQALGRAFAQLTSTEHFMASNPEDGKKFTAGPLDSFSAEMAASGQGRFKPGMQGTSTMLGGALKQVVKGLNADEIFMTAEAYLDTGLHWIMNKTGPDTMEMSQVKIGKPFFMGLLTITGSSIMTVSRAKPDKDASYQMARAMTGNRRLLESGWVGRKRPAFVGRMFSPQSAIYGATPALKIAMAVRWEESRAALGMWPKEYSRFKGDNYTRDGKPDILKHIRYMELMSNDEGPIRSLTFGGLVSGFDDIRKLTADHMAAQGAGLADMEADDDVQSLMARSPLAPGSVAFGAPYGARSLAEARANWYGQDTVKTTMLLMGFTSSVPFALGAAAGIGLLGFKGLRAFQGRKGSSLADVIERNMPTHKARVMGTVLSPEAPGGPGGHSRWTLNAHRGFYRVDLPQMGGEGLMAYGDSSGRPFTHTTDPTGKVLYAGYSKARTVESAFNNILAEYETLSKVRTAGGLSGSISHTYEMLRKLQPSAAGAKASGHTPSAAWLEATTKLDDFRTTHVDPLGKSAQLGDDVLHAYEKLMRSILGDFGSIAGLAPLDQVHVMKATNMTGLGWFKHLWGFMGLAETPTPHVPSSPGTIVPGGPKPADFLHANGSTVAYQEHIQQLDARLLAAKPSGFGNFLMGRGAAGGAGAALGYYMGGNKETAAVGAVAGLALKEGMWLATRVLMPWQIASGLGGQTATNLTEEQREEYRKFGGMASYFGATNIAAVGLGAGASMAGNRLASGATAAAATVGTKAVIGVAAEWGLLGLAALASSTLVAPVVAGLVLGGSLIATHYGYTKPLEDAMVSGIGSIGRALSKLPGAQSIGNALVSAGIWSQLAVSESLWAFQKTHMKDGQPDAWGRAIGVLREVQEGMFGFAPGQVMQGPKADQAGHSWTGLSSLWRASSPIWWGTSKPGIGWMVDSMDLEIDRQERLRLSGAMGRDTVLHMVSHETLGIMSGSNEFPAHNANLRSLYMERGRGTGGMGNAQEERAFKYVQLSRPDQIIQDELLRRGIRYETGVLGGVLRRPDHAYGGFIGGNSRVTTTGHARPQSAGGRTIKPANGGDLSAALSDALGGGGRYSGPLASQPRALDPHFAAAAEATGIPEGIIRAIARRETGFMNYKPTARSPVGALGIMQTMPDWWSKGGNWTDPAQNIMKGAQVIKLKRAELRARLGHEPSWDMVAGAYNSGTSGVLDHNSIREYRETRNYVALFHADYFSSRKLEEKPLLTAGQQKQLATVLPQYMSGNYAGSLDKFMIEQGGVSPVVAKVLAGRVRSALYSQDKWLPQDDPAAWSRISASLGRIASAQDKAEAVLTAAGIPQPAGAILKTGGTLVTLAGGTQVVVPKGWEVTKTSNFLDRRPGHLHGGVDYVLHQKTNNKGGWSSANAPILAAEKGTIVAAAMSGVQGFGSWIKIKTADGREVIYGHPSSINVRIGDQVEPGTLLGTQGQEGHSQGYHVHKEIRDNRGLVDPGQFSRQHPVAMTIDKTAMAKYEQIRDTIVKNIDSLYQGNQISRMLQERMGMTPQRANDVENTYRQNMSDRGFSVVQTHTADGRAIPYDVRDLSKPRAEKSIPEGQDGSISWGLAGALMAGGLGYAMLSYKVKSWLGFRRRQEERGVPANVEAVAKRTTVSPATVNPELAAIRQQMENVRSFKGEVHKTSTQWVLEHNQRKGTRAVIAGSVLSHKSNTQIPAGIRYDHDVTLLREGLGVLDVGERRLPAFTQVAEPARGAGHVMPWEQFKSQPSPYLEVQAKSGRAFMVNREAWLWLTEIRKQGGFLRYHSEEADVFGAEIRNEHDQTTGFHRERAEVVRSEIKIAQWSRGKQFRPQRLMLPETTSVAAVVRTGRQNQATPPGVIPLPGRVTPHRGPDGRFMKTPTGSGAHGLMDFFVGHMGRRLTSGVGKYATDLGGVEYTTFEPHTSSSSELSTRVLGRQATRTIKLQPAEQVIPSQRAPIGFERAQGLNATRGTSSYTTVVHQGQTYGLGSPVAAVPALAYEPLMLLPGHEITRGRPNGIVTPNVINLSGPNQLMLDPASAAPSRGRANGTVTPSIINLPGSGQLMLAPASAAPNRGRANGVITPSVINLPGSQQLLLTPGGQPRTRGQANAVVTPSVIPLGPVEGPTTIVKVGQGSLREVIHQMREARWAINEYVTSSFELNKALAQGKTLDEHQQRVLRGLQYAGTTTQEDMTLRRNTTLNERVPNNRTVISTTQTSSEAFSHGLVVRVGAGTRVIDLNKPSLFGYGSIYSISDMRPEQEVMILPGQAEKISYSSGDGTVTGSGPRTIYEGQLPQNIRDLSRLVISRIVPRPVLQTSTTPVSWANGVRGGVVAAGIVGAIFAAKDAMTLSHSSSTQEERERAKVGLGFGISSATAGTGALLAAAKGMAAAAKTLAGSSMALGVATMIPDVHQLATATSREKQGDAGFNVLMGGALLGGSVLGTGAMTAAGIALLPATLAVTAIGVSAAAVIGAADYSGHVRRDVGGLIASGYNRTTTLAATPRKMLGQTITSIALFFTGVAGTKALNEDELSTQNLEVLRKLAEIALHRPALSPEGHRVMGQPKDYNKLGSDSIDMRLMLGRAAVRPVKIGGKSYYHITDTYDFNRTANYNSDDFLNRAYSTLNPKPDRSLSVAQKSRDVLVNPLTYAWRAVSNPLTTLQTVIATAATYTPEKAYGVDVMIPAKGAVTSPRPASAAFVETKIPIPAAAAIEFHDRSTAEQPAYGTESTFDQYRKKAKPSKKTVVIDTGAISHGRQGKQDTSQEIKPRQKPAVVIKGGKAQLKGVKTNAGRQGKIDTTPMPGEGGLVDRAAGAVYTGLLNTGWF